MSAKEVLMAASGNALPTFISSSTNQVTSTSNTVTAPTSIQNGDLLIALTYTVAAANVTPPAGFSQIYTQQTANPFVSVNIKTAASESGNYTFTASASTDFTVVILVYRNATRINTLGGINRTSTPSATANSITPTFQGTLLAAFSRNSGGEISSTPSGFTLREGPGAGIPYVWAYEKSSQGVSSTGSKSLVYTTPGTHSGIQLQITNEPTVAPEFVASASKENAAPQPGLAITKPTGTLEGDLMVAVMLSSTTSNTTWTGAAGWTEVADQDNVPNVRVAYKVAGASEGSIYNFSNTVPTDILAGCILTYRYADYDDIGDFTDGNNPLILPSISPSQSQSVLLAVGGRRVVSATLGTPISMISRASLTSQPSYQVCDQTVAKGPVGTRSMTTGTTSDVAGIMLSIKPTRSL